MSTIAPNPRGERTGARNGGRQRPGRRGARTIRVAAVHEAALGMAEVGVMSKRAMKVFDEMCLTRSRTWRRSGSVRSDCGSMRARRCSPAT